MTSISKHYSPIKKIFIANRGEIARRIALTSQKLGISSVCLTDRAVPPAYLAGIVSEFIHVSEESTQLYLSASQMISLAKASQCDAVHPGFGFLSENAEFATAVIAAGLTWIGPNPRAIEAMASKATARIQAEKSGVSCLPGLNGLELKEGETTALRELESFASKAGFPLLMKAAYGGGGKGMRIVEKASDLIENAKRAASEALSSFGNGSLIVEKYLPAPRHVEVQVMADKHGHVHIFGDRDCSLQRRHQKILEEAPAPNIPQKVRSAMHAAAKNLAAAVNYDSAGTVEFLLDESNPEDVKYYFLEMNTRLQVEHTVTEEVFGIDLVELQIRSARGEVLFTDETTRLPIGHSIEVRIYAEDPGSQFFPAPGPVRAFVPAQGRGIRWEIGMDTVDEISTRFDPMISKLVCTATTRPQALELVAQTLERTLFAGPRNNIPFLIWLCRNSSVIERPVTTHFIAAQTANALAWEAKQRQHLQISADLILDKLAFESLGATEAGIHSQKAMTTSNSLTLSAFSKVDRTQRHQDDQVKILKCNIAWNPSQPATTSRFGFGQKLNSQGVDNSFSFVSVQSPRFNEYWVGFVGHNWRRIDERMSSQGSSEGSKVDGMSAPVPGKVMAIHVQEHTHVEVGQIIFTLESMKMQFEVKAGKAGKVHKILVSIGDQVNAGQELGAWVD